MRSSGHHRRLLTSFAMPGGCVFWVLDLTRSTTCQGIAVAGAWLCCGAVTASDAACAGPGRLKRHLPAPNRHNTALLTGMAVVFMMGWGCWVAVAAAMGSTTWPVSTHAASQAEHTEAHHAKGTALFVRSCCAQTACNAAAMLSNPGAFLVYAAHYAAPHHAPPCHFLGHLSCRLPVMAGSVELSRCWPAVLVSVAPAVTACAGSGVISWSAGTRNVGRICTQTHIMRGEKLKKQVKCGKESRTDQGSGVWGRGAHCARAP